MNSGKQTVRRSLPANPNPGRLAFLSVSLLVTLMLAGVQGFVQGGQPPQGAQGQNAPGRRINETVKPFKLIGNIYYVGMSDMTIFLITTPQGHMLIDTGYEENVPWIRESIETLGFKLRDNARANVWGLSSAGSSNSRCDRFLYDLFNEPSPSIRVRRVAARQHRCWRIG